MHHYPWLILNMLLHGAAVFLLPLVAALLWRDHGKRIDARLAAAMAIGSALFAFITTPGVMPTPAPWHAPLLTIVAGNPFVIWLLSRALLDDEFALRRWHLVAWLALALRGTVLAVVPHDPQIGRLVLAAPTLALMLLTAVQALANWREDLVEQRRRLRLVIVVAVSLYMFGTQALVLTVFGNERLGPLGNTVITAALLGLAVFIAWRIVRVPRDLFMQASPALKPEPFLADDERPEVEQPDPRLIDSLNELMQLEQIYREENLTIAALARRMKLSEPRLRHLINKELGHRNFNAFLNAFRIEDAKRSLADVRYAEVPILTISAEAGFQSLGPFNRAFKAATGMTPTDFRRTAATTVSARAAMG
ncbi:MAG: helix-turn-helix domain-containing protein [Rhizobacter sp.]